MNRDDIIRMAKESGFLFQDAGYAPEIMHTEPHEYSQKCFERFAALIADAKDAEHQQTLALQQRSYEREIEIEVEAEREACAKVCDGWLHADGDHCAAAIRARGNT